MPNTTLLYGTTNFRGEGLGFQQLDTAKRLIGTLFIKTTCCKA